MISPLFYELARKISHQPIHWDNPEIARLQHEVRLHYVEKISTFDLIGIVARDEEDFLAFVTTLTQIQASEEVLA